LIRSRPDVFQKFTSSIMGREQALESFQHRFIPSTRIAQKFLALLRRADSQRLLKDGFFVIHRIRSIS
jgi:hypothetical protein